MAAVIAIDESPASLIGVVPSLAALWQALPTVAGFFQTGAGMGWGDYDPSLTEAQARFTRPLYRASLTSAWIPSVPGLADRLAMGARVADVGCGHGVSTILAAEAWPASSFIGFDVDPSSIERARAAAAAAGVRAEFGVADAGAFAGDQYDLILLLDCLHDMGDPVAAAAHARSALAPDGVVLAVEPLAADRLEDNLTNPYARIGYAISTLVCTPSALAQAGGAALGAMAGETRLRQVLADAGFSRVDRIAEAMAPFNIVLAARP
jgi:SAM-dependent methyltransferase